MTRGSSRCQLLNCGRAATVSQPAHKPVPDQTDLQGVGLLDLEKPEGVRKQPRERGWRVRRDADLLLPSFQNLRTLLVEGSIDCVERRVGFGCIRSESTPAARTAPHPAIRFTRTGRHERINTKRYGADGNRMSQRRTTYCTRNGMVRNGIERYGNYKVTKGEARAKTEKDVNGKPHQQGDGQEQD